MTYCESSQNVKVYLFAPNLNKLRVYIRQGMNMVICIVLLSSL